MDAPPTTAEMTALLERLSIPDLETRLLDLRAEDKALRALLRTLRAREAVLRRKVREREGQRDA